MSLRLCKSNYRHFTTKLETSTSREPRAGWKVQSIALVSKSLPTLLPAKQEVKQQVSHRILRSFHGSLPHTGWARMETRTLFSHQINKLLNKTHHPFSLVHLKKTRNKKWLMSSNVFVLKKISKKCLCKLFLCSRGLSFLNKFSLTFIPLKFQFKAIMKYFFDWFLQ